MTEEQRTEIKNALIKCAEEKQDIPPCVYCVHCKARYVNSFRALYYCNNSYKVHGVTGEKIYNYCTTVRHGERCNFEPSFCYKIKKLFSK